MAAWGCLAAWVMIGQVVWESLRVTEIWSLSFISSTSLLSYAIAEPLMLLHLQADRTKCFFTAPRTTVLNQRPCHIRTHFLIETQMDSLSSSSCVRLLTLLGSCANLALSLLLHCGLHCPLIRLLWARSRDAITTTWTQATSLTYYLRRLSRLLRSHSSRLSHWSSRIWRVTERPGLRIVSL